MSKSQSRIIEKMKKLLAMAEGKANENEAMTAARQLHALLAKHNISMDELNEASDEEVVGQEGEVERDRPWKRMVAMYIAKLYFCEFYTSQIGSRKSQYMFVGTEANRTFAMHIFKMVVAAIERESRAESRKIYGKQNSSFVRSFWAGAKDRIIERCKELMESAKEGTLEDEEGNTLPALLSTYERNQLQVESWIDENLKLKSKTARTRANNSLGVSKGREAGGRVQLSRAIHGNRSPKLLGNGG